MSYYKYTKKELETLLKSITIIVDSRENANDHIIKYFDKKKIPHISNKLDYGDYSCYLPSNPELGIMRDLYFDCYIERKNSLEEISTNIGSKRVQFESELLRAKDSKFTIMIEKKENEQALSILNKIVKSNPSLSNNEINILKKAINGIGSFEDIIFHNYDTEYNEKSFIASLLAFKYRYDIDINFIEKKCAGFFIHKQLYYYVYEQIKR